MESIARITLGKARFFVDQPSRTHPNNQEARINYLEAAIIFMRSVTFHLQKQFAHTTGFNEWYTQQQRLGTDRLSRYLLEQRNYVLKQGPVNIQRVIELEMPEAISVSQLVSVYITRGEPCYRRPLNILLDDAIYPVRERLHRWHDRRSAMKAAQTRRHFSSGAVRETLFFNEPEWACTPAIDLLRKQLDFLEVIVLEAEARFLDSTLA
jgi:hypothetical protein